MRSRIFSKGSHGRLQPHHPRRDVARYDGWRIVAACFLLATFGWGLGFYGQGVYLAELHRLHGWPTSLISTATTFFYLFGAVLVALSAKRCDRSVRATACSWRGGDGRRRRPDRRDYRAVAALRRQRAAGIRLGRHQPRRHQQYARLWFDRKRGMAISLALNGASFGGIVGVPLLVAAIEGSGFPAR